MSSVDVVILTWNDGELLDAAVGSALSSTGVEVSVWVIDNASHEVAVCVDDPRVRLVRNSSNLGVARARNQGVAFGVAPYVLLLDSDASLGSDALRALLAVLDTDPRIGCAGPVFVDQSPEASGGRAPTLGTKLARLLGTRDTYEATEQSGDSWDVDVVIGACQLFRRVAYEGVGGIDERYFYGPEDVDFCMRLRENGWRVVQVAGAPVRHPPRRRNRAVLTLGGLRHGWAVSRFLWHHRHYRGGVSHAS
jgi:N-acetylglucosaminyl-diphospho-decaprenol L-rhamnosyltransferase